jgi:hypothetical protein
MNDRSDLGVCTLCERDIYRKEIHYPILNPNYDAIRSSSGLYLNFSRAMSYRYTDAETNTVIHRCLGCGVKLPNSLQEGTEKSYP